LLYLLINFANNNIDKRALELPGEFIDATNDYVNQSNHIKLFIEEYFEITNVNTNKL
jgi:hypothetical protein